MPVVLLCWMALFTSVDFLLPRCVGLFEAVLPSEGTLYVEDPDIGTLAKLAHGRILLCLLKRGMTAEQAAEILGQPQWVWPHEGLGWLYTVHYPDYGVTVDMVEAFGG